MSDVKITAYNVKTKEKGVEMHDAVITKTAKGAYMAQGNDGKGNKPLLLVLPSKAGNKKYFPEKYTRHAFRRDGFFIA